MSQKITPEDRARIINIATTYSFEVQKKHGTNDDEYDKQIKLNHTQSKNVVFIDKKNDYKKKGFKVCVHPDRFVDSICNGTNFSLWETKNNRNLTPHSAFKGFPVDSAISKEPLGTCYRVKGDFPALEALLRELLVAWNQPGQLTGSTFLSSGTPARSVVSASKNDMDSPIIDGSERASMISTDMQTSLESDTPNLKTDEREAVVKVRFGQGRFREKLFSDYKEHGEKCWMSGIEGKRLLIASHIRPWSHCKEEPDSRGNTDNGLLLSALWDTVFDAGLISFDADYKVVASSELSESARCSLNLNKYSALPETFRTDGRRDFLAYHRAEVFENWKMTEPKTDLS